MANITINISDDDITILSSELNSGQLLHEYLEDKIKTNITNQILARVRREIHRKATEDATRLSRTELISIMNSGKE